MRCVSSKSGNRRVDLPRSHLPARLPYGAAAPSSHSHLVSSKAARRSQVHSATLAPCASSLAAPLLTHQGPSHGPKGSSGWVALHLLCLMYLDARCPKPSLPLLARCFSCFRPTSGCLPGHSAFQSAFSFDQHLALHPPWDSASLPCQSASYSPPLSS